MTKKLFWDDPYLTACKAQVTSLEGNKIKIDQTIFYAFSGGQESDDGTIGGMKVVQAVKQGDRENIIDIEYELEQEPPFRVGDEVEIKIDREKRLKLMKLHSAVHLAYFFITEKFGTMKILGSNITPEKSRVDFESAKPLTELNDVETKLNAFLAEHHPIVRTRDEKSPDLLWWQCAQWKMPCGGTHPRNTSEIGKLRLKRVGKGAGKERVEIYLY